MNKALYVTHNETFPIFAKDMCTPQDIISALSLFGDDGVRFHIAVDDVELNVSQEQN